MHKDMMLSIVMDRWINISRGGGIINIIVTTIVGPFLLRDIDFSGKCKDATLQFVLHWDAIEDFGPPMWCRL
jgi:hypothetical protein